MRMKLSHRWSAAALGVVFASCALGLTACGQRGPLYLPPPEAVLPVESGAEAGPTALTEDGESAPELPASDSSSSGETDEDSDKEQDRDR